MSLIRTGLHGVFAVALLLATGASAAAQQGPPNTVGPTERMQSHSAWHLSRMVSAHVGRVLIGPELPAGSAGIGEDAPAAAMYDGSPGLFGGPDTPGPVASATAQAPAWSVWVGPNVTWSDQDDPVAGNKGHMVTTHVGLDRRLGQRGVFGIMAGFEFSDFDTATLDGRLETQGAGVGIYGGYSLTDRIVFDALALYTWLDNDYSDRARSASYDSGRLQLSANLTGYLTKGRFGIRPKLGVSYSLDNQEAYRDTLGFRSPESDTETVSATGGMQVGYTFFLDETRTIEPYIGAAAIVEDSSTDPSPAAGGDELGDFDVRLSAGFSAWLAERLSISLNADVSGLARGGYQAMTVGGQLSLRF